MRRVMKRDLWRYARQIQVIGEPAQRAVLAGRASVCGEGLAATFEALYLAGAGIGTLEASPTLAGQAAALNGSIAVLAQRDLPEALGERVDNAILSEITDESARAAAAGALRALGTLAEAMAAFGQTGQAWHD